VKTKGWGKARNVAMMNARYPFVIMVNADVDVSPQLYSYLLDSVPGTVFMNINYDAQGVGTRVFAMWYVDFRWRVQFDSSIKHVFEDGDFYARALQSGLTVKFVPPTLYSHPDHKHDYMTHDYRRTWFVEWEFSRMFIKHNFQVERNHRNLFLFFDPLNCPSRFLFYLARIPFTAFWIVRSFFAKLWRVNF